LIAALPQIFSAAGQLIGALATGLWAFYPLLGDAIIKVLDTLIKTLFSKRISLISVGKDFISGLIEGISSAAGFLYDAVAEVVSNMLSTITEALGISSPSKVGRAIGRNLFESQALGAMDALRNVEQTFSFATRQLATGMAVASGAGASSLDQSVNSRFDIYGNVIIQGSTPPEGVGAALRARRF